jgi:hypothetical protein
VTTINLSQNSRELVRFSLMGGEARDGIWNKLMYRWDRAQKLKIKKIPSTAATTINSSQNSRELVRFSQEKRIYGNGIGNKSIYCCGVS